jgi:iron complex transport system permease protein
VTSRTDLRRSGLLGISAALLLAAMVLSLVVGVHTYGVADVVDLVRGADTDATTVLQDLRLPRVALALAAGLSLALAGTLSQAVTRNPLADPGMLGVSAGAGFAVTIAAAVAHSIGQTGQVVVAFVGAALTGAVVFTIGRTSPLLLVLVGVAISSMLMGVSLGLRMIYPDVFDSFRGWAVGTVAGREQTPLVLPLVLMGVASLAVLLVIRPLSAIALGDDVAQAMGVAVVRTRVLVFLLVTLLTAVATAVVGPIAFVGLIVPMLARGPAGGSVAWMLALTALWGPVLLLVCDVLARIALPTGEIPVSVVTAFVGGFALIAAVREDGLTR